MLGVRTHIPLARAHAHACCARSPWLNPSPLGGGCDCPQAIDARVKLHDPLLRIYGRLGLILHHTRDKGRPAGQEQMLPGPEVIIEEDLDAEEPTAEDPFAPGEVSDDEDDDGEGGSGGDDDGSGEDEDDDDGGFDAMLRKGGGDDDDDDLDDDDLLDEDD